jgi:phosphoglucomutase
MNYLDEYTRWLESDFIDEDTKNELIKIKDDKKEIEDRFYKNLEFGTAGLRGIIGAGTNRMNKYTVSKATQGLANYIIKNNRQSKGVAIAYDSRHMSKEFSEITANCLNANGIKTYVFESLRSVPELSYTVRKLGCTAGVMITASHNPSKYNGYKVYWDDGAQVVPPHDKGIIEEVNKIEKYEDAKTINKDEAIEKGLYNTIGKEVDDCYIKELKKLSLNPNVIKEQKDLKIVYTPLHGTGRKSVQRILKEIGFENVYTVPEQEEPDGDFPTVDYPNPEDKNAFKLALDLAKNKNADIVLATDPDADRLGVYAKDSETGKYMPFTGNMSGMLIAEYILSQRKEKSILNNNGALITTIVSTDLAKAIAKEYNIELFEVLTGFKYIGEKIRQFEENKNYAYEFGFEESYGCLIGTYARDKDAIAAVMMLCEAAAYYKSKGLTLWDQMLNIYKKYGYYKEDVMSLTFEGVDGAEKIKEILNNLRTNPLLKIWKYKVLEFRDYKEEKIINMLTKDEKKTQLPNSNVLYYELENNCWCCVRPSGTEPKIKFYIGVKEKNEEEADNAIKQIKEELLKYIQK